MSSIDERVVEMQFNNQQFESGIKESTKSLDRLKESLNLDGASKGLDNVSKAVSNFTMDGVTTAVETSSHSFSALETVATAALVNITSQAVQAGEQLLASLSVDQISAGYDKYTQKLSNVQTIMNSTGDSIDTVNGYMDHLMWYSDETSYGFTDMTTALANMVSVGGEVDSLIPMIEGVANATAYAGQNATAFSYVMSAINSGYSRGYMQATDWARIEHQNAASKELKTTLIETAESLGKLEEGEVTLENFKSTLSTGKWLDTEVLEQGFSVFSEMTEAAYDLIEAGEYDTATEAYAALESEYGDIAVAAAEAAQQAKTFGEAIDATKDAVSSKWSDIMQSIFGDYDQATQLWTDVSEELYDIFAEPLGNFGKKIAEAFSGDGTAWSNITDQIEEAGVSANAFEEALNSVTEAQGLDALVEECGSVEEAFSSLTVEEKASWISAAIDELCTSTEVTGTSMEELGDIVTRVIQGEFGDGEERIQALTEAGYDYATVQEAVNLCWQDGVLSLDALSDEELESLGYSEETIAALRKLQDALGDTSSEFYQALTTMDDGMSGFEALWGGLGNIGKTIESLGSAIADAWSDVFPKTTANGIRSALQSFYNITQKIFLGIEDAASKLQSVFRGLFSVIDMGKDIIVNFAKGAFSLLKDALGNCSIDILGVVGAIGDLIFAFRNWFSENKIAEKAVNGLIGIIKALWNGLVNLKDSFLNLPIVQSALTSLSNVGKKALNSLNETFPETTGWVKALIDSFKETGEINFDILEKAFKSLGKELGDLVSGAFPRTSKAISNFIKKTNGDFSQLNLQAVIKLLKKFKKDFVDLVLDIVDNSEFLSGIRDKIDSFIETFKELTGIDLSWDGLTKSFTKLKESIEEFAKTHFGDTYKAVDDFINGLIEDFGNFSFDDVIGIINTFKNDLVKAFNDLINENELLSGIREKITSLVNKIKEFFNVDFSGVGDAFSNLKTIISTAITDILKAFGLIKDESEDGLEGTAEEVTSPLEVIKTAFNNVKKSLSGLGSSILGVIKSVFDSLIDKIKGLKDNLVKAVDDFIENNEFLSGFREKVSTFIEWVKEFFNIDFSGVGESFSSLKDTIGGAITSVLQSIGILKDDSTGDVEGTAEELKSPLEIISEAFNNVKESLSDFASSVGEALSGISVSKLLGIAAAIGGIYTLFKAGSAIGSIGSFGTTLKSISKGIKAFTKETKATAFATTIKAITTSLLELVAAVAVLGKLNGDELKQGLASLGVLAVGLLGLSKALSKIKFSDEGSGIKGVAAVILSFAASVLIIVEAIKELTKIQNDVNWETIGILAGILVAILLVIADFNFTSKASSKGSNYGAALTILAFAESVKIIASALKQITKFQDDIDGPAAIALIVIMGAVIGAIAVFNKTYKEGSVGSGVGLALELLAFSESIKIIASALKQITKFSDDIDGPAAAAFLVTIAAVIGAIIAFNLTSKGTSLGSSIGMAAELLAFAESIKIIVSALKSITKMSDALGDPMVISTFVAILITVIGSLILLGKTNTGSLLDSIGIAADLIAVSASIKIAVSALKDLSEVSGSFDGTTIAALVVMMIGIVGSLEVLSKTCGPEALAAGVAMLAVAAALKLGISALTDLANLGMDTIGPAIENLINIIVEALSKFGERIPEVVKSVVTMVKNFITTLPTTILNAFGLESFSDIGPAISALVQKIVEWFKQLPAKLKEFFNGELVQSILSSVSGFIKELPGKIGQALVNFGEGIDGPFGSIISKIGEGLLGISDFLDQDVGSPGEFISGLVAHIGEFIIGIPGAILESVGQWLVNMGEGMDGPFGTVISKIGGGLLSIGEALDGDLGSPIEFIGNLVQSIGEFIIGIPSAIAEAAGQWLVDFGEGKDGPFGTIISTIGGGLLGIGEALDGDLGSPLEFIGNLVEKIGEFILGIPGAIIEAAGEWLVDFGEGKDGPFGTIISKIGGGLLGIGEALEGDLGSPLEFITNLVGKIGEFIAGIPAGIEEAVGDWLTGIGDGIDGPFGTVISEIGGAISGLGQSIEEFVGNPVEFVEGVASDVGGFISGIPNAISEVIDSIGDFVGEDSPLGGFISNVKEGIGGLPGKISEAIGNIGEDIGEHADNVTGAISSFVESVKIGVADFDLESALSTVTDGVGSAIDTVKGAVSGIATDLGLDDNINDITTAVGTFVDNLTGDLENLTLEGALNGLETTCQGIGSSIGNFVGGIAGGVAEGFTADMPDTATNMSNFMTELEPFLGAFESLDTDVFSKISGLAVALIELTASDLVSGIKNFIFGDNDLSNITNAIKGLAEGLSGITWEDPTQMVATLEGIAKACEAVDKIDNNQRLSKILGSGNDSLGARLKEFSEDISGCTWPSDATEMSTILTGIADAASVLDDTDLDTFYSVLEDSGESLKNFANDLDGVTWPDMSAFVDLIDALCDMTERVDPSKISDTGTELQTALTKFQTLIIPDSLFDDLSDFVDALTSVDWPTDYPNIDSSVKSLQSGIDEFEKIKFPSTETLDNFAKELSTALDGAGDAGAQAMIDALLSYEPNVKSAGVTLIVALSDGMSNSVALVTTACDDICQSALAIIIGYQSKFQSQGSTLIRELANGMNQAASEVTNAIKSILDSVVNTANTYRNSMYDVGYNMALGYANGISNGTNLAVNAATNMAVQAINAANNAQESHSPSRITERSGMWFDQGYANGINKFIPLIKAAAEDAADTAVDTLSGEMNGISTEMDLNPTITPVLDLSQIQSGAAAMNGMLYGGTGLSIDVGRANRTFGSVSQFQNGQRNPNADILRAIEGLNEGISERRGNTYNINGVTYDDGSNVSSAVEQLFRVLRLEGRA